MAKSKGQGGRGGAVKPHAPVPASHQSDWDPKWEATDHPPAYVITPNGTILDNRKVLASAEYEGDWGDSHSDTIRAIATRNGWAKEGYATLGKRNWSAGRMWEGVGRGGFVDVRVPETNPAAGFKRAQRALQKLIDLGSVTVKGRFTYAWGLGAPGTSYQGQGQWAGSVDEFLNASNWRDLGAG